MREIKFRIWDKQFNKYFFILPLEHHFTWPRFDVQQFTGLKDKNGKEIYEGDIVSKTDRYGFQIGVVKDYCWWQVFKESSDLPKSRYVAFTFSPQNETFDAKEFEIIGNIYENPELLTSN